MPGARHLVKYHIKPPAETAYPALREDIPFFALFPDNALLKLVSESGCWLSVPPDVPVITDREKGRTFYVPINGKLGVFKGERPIALVRKGELFGEIGALLGEQRTASVITMQQSMLFEGDSDVLCKLPKEIIVPFLMHAFAQTAHRLKAADRRLAYL